MALASQEMMNEDIKLGNTKEGLTTTTACPRNECRGLYDPMVTSVSAGLGGDDRRIGTEALFLRQSMTTSQCAMCQVKFQRRTSPDCTSLPVRTGDVRDNAHKKYESACESVDPEEPGFEESEEFEMPHPAVADIAASPCQLWAVYACVLAGVLMCPTYAALLRTALVDHTLRSL